MIAVTGITPAPDRWMFADPGAAPGGGMVVPVRPKLVVNSVEAAVDVALGGGGLTRLLSYQSAAHEAAGALQRVLRAYELPPVPIHIVHPAGRYLPIKVRRFIDLAVVALRKIFEAG